MKVRTRSSNFQQHLPPTQVTQALNGQLTLFLRGWGGTEYNQKVVDEIIHYLSSTEADLEVTTPFQYFESLTTLANRTRVGLLLAHDLIYKNDNRNEYAIGFEAMLVLHSKSELAWSSVGRFSLAKIEDNYLNLLLSAGSDLDHEVLMPVHLMGVEREIHVNSGSMQIENGSKILISSGSKCTFRLAEKLDPNAESGDEPVEVVPTDSTYWFSVLTTG